MLNADHWNFGHPKSCCCLNSRLAAQQVIFLIDETWNQESEVIYTARKHDDLLLRMTSWVKCFSFQLRNRHLLNLQAW